MPHPTKPGILWVCMRCEGCLCYSHLDRDICHQRRRSERWPSSSGRGLLTDPLDFKQCHDSLYYDHGGYHQLPSSDCSLPSLCTHCHAENLRMQCKLHPCSCKSKSACYDHWGSLDSILQRHWRGSVYDAIFRGKHTRYLAWTNEIHLILTQPIRGGIWCQ